MDAPLYGFGRKQQLFMDLPMHGRRVRLVIDCQRYRCRACGATFREPLPDINEKHMCTERMAAYVSEQASRRNWASAKAPFGTSLRITSRRWRRIANKRASYRWHF
ncbi:transposase family protein [Sulfobacillus sp. DSM 109850]|uniref:Transposase family protein n=1 Tax=Sulfobacillus harzensis TaxID=2729629 RepID=A0A7Y0L9H0_9FIRM|nr:transposase family protein [Sulfobacillus harzensis]